MRFLSSREIQEHIVSEVFAELLVPTYELKIFTKDGNVSIVSRDLLRFFSPLVNSIFKDVPCCTNSMVFIPESSKASVDHVLSIIGSGITDFNALSIKQIQEVQETAKMLEIDLTNMDYVEKSKVMIPDFDFAANARKEELPACQKGTNENEKVLQIKPEPYDNTEALLEADSAAVEVATKIKEESLNQNVEVPNCDEKTAEKSVDCSPAKSHPFLAPTPPSESEAESSKPSSLTSPKHEEYLHKIKSSKRGTKRSISEETMAALAKMMKDPKRKPTTEEMEELLSRTMSFRDLVSRPDEIRRESSRLTSTDRRSDSRRSHSKDRRPSAVDRRSVTPERRSAVQNSSSSYPGVAHPSPAQFPFMQTQHVQHQFSQYQNHPQMPQQGQVQPQIQYMVQPGGAVQAYVPGSVPVQYPYNTVQGMDPVQYSMVQAPLSTVQYQVRSPSPVKRRRSPSKSSSSSDISKYYSRVVKKSDRTMAEKKASLLTMTVEEKRLMTCLDWNSGLCPRLDSGKLCVFNGSKKKHICSKVIKSSKFGGSKVCWANHREGEHKDFKDRVEFSERERRESSRVRDHRS
eukprot:GFUD01042181.1.p1 GENE.GFUD01042181.1~~GFUD01042181.1.p1  ORF type:complete len:574 (-),score=131.87 GFUD01042181.1:6-1727(-)